MSADLALVLGGRLKYEEMLSGRFADAFGTLYLGYSCLWYYKQLQAQGTHQNVLHLYTLTTSYLLIVKCDLTHRIPRDNSLGLYSNFPPLIICRRGHVWHGRCSRAIHGAAAAREPNGHIRCCRQLPSNGCRATHKASMFSSRCVQHRLHLLINVAVSPNCLFQRYLKLR